MFRALSSETTTRDRLYGVDEVRKDLDFKPSEKKLGGSFFEGIKIGYAEYGRSLRERVASWTDAAKTTFTMLLSKPPFSNWLPGFHSTENSSEEIAINSSSRFEANGDEKKLTEKEIQENFKTKPQVKFDDAVNGYALKLGETSFEKETEATSKRSAAEEFCGDFFPALEHSLDSNTPIAFQTQLVSAFLSGSLNSYAMPDIQAGGSYSQTCTATKNLGVHGQIESMTLQIELKGQPKVIECHDQKGQSQAPKELTHNEFVKDPNNSNNFLTETHIDTKVEARLAYSLTVRKNPNPKNEGSFLVTCDSFENSYNILGEK